MNKKSNKMLGICLVLALLLVVLSVSVYAVTLNHQQQLNYARAFFIAHAQHPEVSDLEFARIDFLYKAGVIK